ncbi:protein phosphatase 1 regulatory subunit 3C-B-like [Ctenopharyngodon idella]|uniref:protein phosphatase 1 regulatory subunit 3C-B-like n=1 Tax=Ctenopharyngodon idella TaxID=7959 RepID=UPI00222EFD9B|nr:protein phosphatase 1 regulatory subunit 3C-B-like [Ctenopharyngodon idella]XP_051766240.1 protein phosphatase 1 regulatory subunit 3C-B-like [Ctenopharyngodon idella]XP_051766241.1 protein phosphatase 1 regulatory subunit 3C-B-like [Ctenopharyngodon idella]XP_051766242.1 protein phosphatase 1 regulatory subunit 3C-B-like [Ctenopharyngodon idella]
MNITKPYGFSSYSFPEHVMPVELAMHAQVSPPVSQLLGMSALRSSSSNISSPELQRPRFSPPSPSSSRSSSSSSSSLSSYSPGRGTLRKKQVVFADAKGLALATVRIFTTDPSETETEDAPQPEESVKARAPMQSARLRLKLGFPQPIADRASLKETLVQLESCSLTERVLSGTVRVCNIKFDKTVVVHITFDSWRSHKEIACTYVREPHATLETDLFAFNVSLPSELDPKEHVEFLMVFRPGNSNLKLVDNNKGKNYQIYVENVAPEPQLVTPSRRNFVENVAPEPWLVTPSRRNFVENVAPEPWLVTPSRRNFIIRSPQRLSAWPGVKSHDLQKMKNLPCKGPHYPDRLVLRTWGRMANVAPLS